MSFYYFPAFCKSRRECRRIPKKQWKIHSPYVFPYNFLKSKGRRKGNDKLEHLEGRSQTRW